MNILAWRKTKEITFGLFPNDVHIAKTLTKGARSLTLRKFCSENDCTRHNIKHVYCVYITTILPYHVINPLPNPCRPLLSVTSVRLCSNSEVISFDQNWHNLYSASPFYQWLTGLIELENRIKRSWKLGGKFPSLAGIPISMMLLGESTPSRRPTTVPKR